MNEVDLSRAVRELVEHAVKDYIIPPKQSRADHTGVKVEVINSFLPPKRSYAKPYDELPIVVVGLESSETEADKTTVGISIIAACYSVEFDGHEYCLNILSRIRNAICSLPFGTLESKYQLEYPININSVAVEYPNWQAEMSTKWTFNAPQVEFGREFE